ncbi:MAG: FtsX-like permease family protein [Nonlabens sp.]
MPANSNYRFDAALSYAYFTDAYPRFAQNWAMTHMGTAFAKAEYSSDNSSLLNKINFWKENPLPENKRGQIQYALQPLADIHNETLYGSSPGGYVTSSQTLWIASGLAFLILFIAVLNFINLSTAKQLNRKKNVSVMKVLGTGKRGLINKMLSEHALIIFIAMIVASLLTFLSIDQINSFPQFNGLHIAFDLKAISLLLCIGIVILIISTALPVLRVIKINTLDALYNKTSNTQSGKTIRSAALVMQFAILQIFLIGSLIVSYQMDLFQNADLGFNQDNVLILPLPYQKNSKQFSDYLSQNSNVINHSFGSGPPMGINDLSLGTQFRLPQQPEDDGVYTELKVGDKNYAAFYGLEILAGKSFTTNRDKLDKFIVNESLIKKFNWSPDEAIGQKIVINEGTGTITGVVTDYHNNALQYELTPSVIANWNSFQLNAFVRLSEINEATLESIRKEWQNIFPESSYSLSFLDEDIAREYQTEQLVHQGFRIAAFISILLGIMGLIGILSFMIVNRSREIAIRKVLGSSVPQILNLISKEFLILSLISLLIAVPLTYYYAQLWLQNFVFHIDLNAWIFIIGSLVSVLIVAAVCAGQIYFKAVENPTRGLKSE